MMAIDWADDHPQAVGRQRNRLQSPTAGALATALVLCASLLLALVYSYVFTTRGFTVLPTEEKAHIAANVVCVAWLGVIAWRARGQLDSKLGQVLTGAVMLYGAFFLLILSGRWFFSRPMLLTSFSVTVAVGCAIVLLKHRLRRPRVGIIGPLAQAAPHAPGLGEVVTDPGADLRSYEILLVAFNEAIDAQWARAMSRAMLAGSRVRHVGEYMEESRGAVSLSHFDLEHIPDFTLTSYRHFKRFFDVALIIFTLPVTLTVLALSALIVYVTMGRPILFMQERVGMGARVFKIWKLRTMRREATGEPVRATVRGDDRVTAVGRVLRRFRIDELPQLWNVLKGDMTLIGPRPEAVAFHTAYLSDTPEWAYRTLVRPGITGWAQVCTEPSANIEEARRKLAYDLYYVKRMSPVLDLKIALRTFWTIASGAGVR